MRRRRLGIVLAVIVVGTFGWLIYGGLDKNVVFFLTPKGFLAKGVSGFDVPVRLGGQVKPGSVQWNANTLDLRFSVTDGHSDVVVRERGAPPQMFRDGMGVVVEGKYGRDSVFHASNLMIKHSNEYRPPKDGAKPSEMYKSLIKGPSK